MRLTTAVVGWLTKKLALVVLIMVSLFVGYLLVNVLVPSVKDAVSERHRLEDVEVRRSELERDLARLEQGAAAGRVKTILSLTGKVDRQIKDGRNSIADQQRKVADLRDHQDEVCGVVGKVIAWAAPGNACKSAEKAVASADRALDTVEGSVGQAERDAAVLRDPNLSDREKIRQITTGSEQSPVERDIATTQSELDQSRAEEKSLRTAQSSGLGWGLNIWATTWRWFALIALLVLVLPPLMRVISYFVLMPIVGRLHSSIELAQDVDASSANLVSGPAQRTLVVSLDEGETLTARSEHLRPVEGEARSRLLYDWSSPFISFAAGLKGLSRITGDARGSSAAMSAPADPDAYLMRIDFTDHPGLVMYPKHVVGVIGAPTLRTRWRWGVAALATWQVRYILFAGTGSLVVQGTGDVVATSPHGRTTKMEQHLLMGFDSRLSMKVARTEVFWPYLWAKTPLIDDEFTGTHDFFWQKSSTEVPSNPLTRFFDAMFSAVGKLLGF